MHVCMCVCVWFREAMLYLGCVDASSSTAKYNLQRGRSLLIFMCVTVVVICCVLVMTNKHSLACPVHECVCVCVCICACVYYCMYVYLCVCVSVYAVAGRKSSSWPSPTSTRSSFVLVRDSSSLHCNTVPISFRCMHLARTSCTSVQTFWWAFGNGCNVHYTLESLWCSEGGIL
jgi:hypothetical protein